MAFSDKKIPYEILIRFDLNGKPQGAHIGYRRRIENDGEVLKDEALPAQPLGIDDFPASDILSETTEAALARVNELSAQVEGLEADVARLTAENAGQATALSHAIAVGDQAATELAQMREQEAERAKTAKSRRSSMVDHAQVRDEKPSIAP